MNQDEHATLAAHLAPHGGSEHYRLEAVAAACRDTYGPGWHATITAEQLLTLAARHVLWGPTADVGCPEWCTLEDGHGFLDEDGHLERWHESPAAGTGSSVLLTITQSETAAGAAGPIARTLPYVVLCFDSNSATADLDVPDLRELSAHLAAAADRLERINECSSVSP